MAKMSGIDWHTVLSGILEAGAIVAAAFYAVVALIHYLSEGPRPRPKFDLHDPARSFEHAAVWLGVSLVAFIVRAGTPVLAMLSEASAEVGDWFLKQQHHETR
jgi:hypothetical protein